ncbi:hypothetical protein ES708_13152 [subsurface metagenome]
MDWSEAKVEIQGLSAAQLRLILQMLWWELPDGKRERLVKLVSSVRRGTEQD